MFPRFFSPTVKVRLFDPMPLPKSGRVRHAGRVRASKNIITFTAVNFTRNFLGTLKRVPANR